QAVDTKRVAQRPGARHTIERTFGSHAISAAGDSKRASGGAGSTGVGTEAEAPPPSVVRMRFLGANPGPEITGSEPLPGIVNYFLGSDPAKWRTNLPTF